MNKLSNPNSLLLGNSNNWANQSSNPYNINTSYYELYLWEFVSSYLFNSGILTSDLTINNFGYKLEINFSIVPLENTHFSSLKTNIKLLNLVIFSVFNLPVIISINSISDPIFNACVLNAFLNYHYSNAPLNSTVNSGFNLGNPTANSWNIATLEKVTWLGILSSFANRKKINNFIFPTLKKNSINPLSHLSSFLGPTWISFLSKIRTNNLVSSKLAALLLSFYLSPSFKLLNQILINIEKEAIDVPNFNCNPIGFNIVSRGSSNSKDKNNVNTIFHKGSLHCQNLSKSLDSSSNLPQISQNGMSNLNIIVSF